MTSYFLIKKSNPKDLIKPFKMLQIGKLILIDNFKLTSLNARINNLFTKEQKLNIH